MASHWPASSFRIKNTPTTPGIISIAKSAISGWAAAARLAGTLPITARVVHSTRFVSSLDAAAAKHTKMAPATPDLEAQVLAALQATPKFDTYAQAKALGVDHQALVGAVKSLWADGDVPRG